MFKKTAKGWMIMMTLAMACWTAQGEGWRTYEQTLTLTFETEAQAREAAVTALPLPVGKKVAFSTRWDDSSPAAVAVAKADVLAEYGYKGTFFLNKVDPAYGENVIRKFLEKGCSAGAHTATHPFLPKIDHNAMFQEILANRIAIESCGDTCVSTFTLPYRAFTSETDPDRPRAIGECLVRAGLNGGPERSADSATKFGRDPREWIGALEFSIDDRNPQLAKFEANIACGLKAIAENSLECGPHLSLGTHNWQPDLKVFGEIIGTQANHPDWWYCNANEYTAYRLQMHHTAIVKKGASGKSATFAIARPVPFELGDRVPLALRTSAGARGAVVDRQALEINAAGEFTLPHADARQLPSRIGAVHNDDNSEGECGLKADPTLPALQAALHVNLARNELTVLVKDASQESLGPLHLTIRLPLKWKRGILKEDIASLNPGEIRKIPLAMGEVEADARYEAGTYYFAVQCDYGDATGAARLYATASVAAQARPAASAAQVEKTMP